MSYKFTNKLWNYFVKRKKTASEVFYTGLNQAWRIISGPLVLVLIPLYLTPELQGYWYTIIGLSLLMIFADMGFTNIILQFSAHEFAHLKLTKNGELKGDPVRIKKLSTLFIFAIKWAFTAALIIVPIVAGASYLLLSKEHSSVKWFLPWLIYLSGSVVTFMNNALISYFEGCDQIASGQRIRLTIGMLQTLILCSMLVTGSGLFSLAVATIVSAIIGTAIILLRFRDMIKNLLRSAKLGRYDWMGEFLPLLSRYAVSWGSGYFIFQVYTPIMFYFNGAIEAGRVGLSIALWMAIFNISNAWIISAVPKMNMHVSRKEYSWLNNILGKRVMLALCTYALGSASFFVLYLSVGNILHITGRFSGSISLMILGLAWMLQIIVNALAVYMRAFREEPMALPSFISALYITVITIICAKYLPLDYYFVGYLTSYIWGLPWVFYLFSKRRGKSSNKNG